MDTLIRLLQERGAEPLPLADAVEYLVRQKDYTDERALFSIDDAIYDGTLTLNNAFEIGLPT